MIDANMYDYTGKPLRTVEQLVDVAEQRRWTLIPRPHDGVIHIFDANMKQIGRFMADEEKIKMVARRSRTVGVQVVYRATDKTYHINVTVDGKPERSWNMGEQPTTLCQAMQFVAADMRMEGNKWDIDGASNPGQ